MTGTASKVFGLALKVYAAATIGNVACILLKYFRKKKALQHLPKMNLKDGENFITKMVENRLRLHDFWKESSDGKPVCAAIATSDLYLLVARDPTVVKHILKDNFDNYTKTPHGIDPETDYFIDFVGGGIFGAPHGKGAPDKGQSWTLQRKIASAIFKRSNFNTNMRDTFLSKSEVALNFITEQIAKDPRVDMQRLFFAFTMDSIMKILCGEESDTINGAACTFGDASDTAQRALIEYTRANMELLMIPSMILPWPLGGHRGLVRKVLEPFFPSAREFRANRKIMNEEAERLIQNCRQSPDVSTRSDLLALFVSAEEEKNFSAAFLRDVITNFMLAGRDTTACLLSWMFYELSINPSVQAKVHAEIDEKLPAGTQPTVQNVSAAAMPILHGIVYETLRLHAPVPADGVYSVDADVLPGGYEIPAGTSCLFLPYAMGRDENLYPEPLEFKPERWIPFKAPAPHEFPVFRAGPRICLGMDMSLFEAKVMATTLLREFRFELAPGEKIYYGDGGVMAICNSADKKSHNLWLLPKKR